MTEQEEEYVHFVSCIENLNNAWIILKRLKRRKNTFLKSNAFKFALIEYSKPYTNSRGILLRNHKLDESFVPITHIELHKRILTSRNQILAHADLTVKEAKILVTRIKEETFVFKVENLIFGTELLADIDSIIELIEQTLDKMYLEEKRLESLLPIKS